MKELLAEKETALTQSILPPAATQNDIKSLFKVGINASEEIMLALQFFIEVWVYLDWLPMDPEEIFPSIQIKTAEHQNQDENPFNRLIATRGLLQQDVPNTDSVPMGKKKINQKGGSSVIIPLCLYPNIKTIYQK